MFCAGAYWRWGGGGVGIYKYSLQRREVGFAGDPRDLQARVIYYSLQGPCFPSLLRDCFSLLQRVSLTLASVSSTPGLVSSSPGMVSSTPGVVSPTPGVVSSTPGMIFSSPSVLFSAPRVVSSTVLHDECPQLPEAFPPFLNMFPTPEVFPLHKVNSPCGGVSSTSDRLS